MVKKAAKASSGTKRKAATPDFSRKAAIVLGECAFAVGRGMEREMGKHSKRPTYVLNDDARDYWIEYHLKSIPKAFKKYGAAASWPKQRPIVTAMAELLGATAAQYAVADAVNAGSPVIQVTVAHVTRATESIRNNRRCVRARVGGRGIYCES